MKSTEVRTGTLFETFFDTFHILISVRIHTYRKNIELEFFLDRSELIAKYTS